jgi:ADP-heptose:LPS heptosyltransferase
VDPRVKFRTKREIDHRAGLVLTALLTPLVRILGFLARRSHDPEARGAITVVKMVGGGSLIIAFPALLALRRRYPRAVLSLVTTNAIAPFGRSLGIFDRIDAIDDSSPVALALTGLRALARNLGGDTVLDLEVYSRLTSIFSTLTLARNRIGFYVASGFWRRPLLTHLVFFNRAAGVHRGYDALARLLGTEPEPVESCRRVLRERLRAADGPVPGRVGLGHGCSELAKERALTPAQWAAVLRPALTGRSKVELKILGGPADRGPGDEIARELARTLPEASVENRAGELGLEDSLRLLATCEEFFGIDSALLHYARLLGVRCTSYWGPTAPETLLRPVPGLVETVRYARIPCSPCVHVAEEPPCRGNNLCMAHLLEPRADLEKLFWLA